MRHIHSWPSVQQLCFNRQCFVPFMMIVGSWPVELLALMQCLCNCVPIPVEDMTRLEWIIQVTHQTPPTRRQGCFQCVSEACIHVLIEIDNPGDDLHGTPRFIGLWQSCCYQLHSPPDVACKYNFDLESPWTIYALCQLLSPPPPPPPPFLAFLLFIELQCIWNSVGQRSEAKARARVGLWTRENFLLRRLEYLA